MDHFTCDFRGSPVSVWYQCSCEGEVVWIANRIVDDYVQSIDGVAFLDSGCAPSDVRASVIRGLQLACHDDERSSCKV